jgi:hypothetical protein
MLGPTPKNALKWLSNLFNQKALLISSREHLRKLTFQGVNGGHNAFPSGKTP